MRLRKPIPITMDASNRQCLAEAINTARYCAKWDATYKWAVDTIEELAGEFVEWPERSKRVARIRISLRGSIVKSMDDEEEAYRQSVPVDDLQYWLHRAAPTLRTGGRRRVVIRVFAWVIDHDARLGYDPEWVKVGDDMSAAAARAYALRWAKSYTEQLNRGYASREIRMTMIEIAFWTSGPRSRTL